ncbi:MAG: Ig-like domain-containing protein, partial [Verrucomicrobiales bacterium]|nr:Ig-like domain-containing protein [Verrucomicrobiales bacterium]
GRARHRLIDPVGPRELWAIFAIFGAPHAYRSNTLLRTRSGLEGIVLDLLQQTASFARDRVAYDIRLVGDIGLNNINILIRFSFTDYVEAVQAGNVHDFVVTTLQEALFVASGALFPEAAIALLLAQNLLGFAEIGIKLAFQFNALEDRAAKLLFAQKEVDRRVDELKNDVRTLLSDIFNYESVNRSCEKPPERKPPVAEDDFFKTTADTTLGVSSPGVLANDRDPDGDLITLVEMMRFSSLGATITTFSRDGSFFMNQPVL